MKRKIALLAVVLCLTMALSPAVLAAEPTQAEVCYPTAVTQSEDGTELRKMYDLGPGDSRRVVLRPQVIHFPQFRAVLALSDGGGVADLCLSGLRRQHRGG